MCLLLCALCFEAETNCDIVVLLEVRPDKGDKLQFYMHMPCPQGPDEGGSGG